MTAYYNEFDPKAAAWLRELIKENLIAKGDVDERSIIDVQPSDLRGYDQCHFFAGIGGWSYALRLAGISDGRESRCETAKAARYRSSVDSAGWANPNWIECRDNKLRPIKSGLEPLVNGISKGVAPGRDPDCSPVARVMRLKGYGNAIVPQVAATFIESFYEVLDNEF